MVSPRSLSSSSGPESASRSCRLRSEIMRVVVVMTRRGRNTRPEANQPRITDVQIMAARSMEAPTTNSPVSSPIECPTMARCTVVPGLLLVLVDSCPLPKAR